MSSDEILLEAEDKMIKTEQVLVNQLAGVRTGKASPSLVENIQAEVYGSMVRIRELGSITTPEPRQLLIQPWDNAALQPIEKAIQKANLGLSPTVQGRLIRLTFPELSTERRQEFVKMAKKMTEDSRVAIRHVRRDALEELKKAVKASETSEEEEEKVEKEVQKLTDQYVAKLETHLAHKEKEILTV
ncbi:MAG TPA: ribosome recycling factor [Candidatus Sulfotelmatobacter sp.]|jgi:ribosome recycling factor|nr:ribosome recycling factor [Candidatus Sulfotelmatobacter sp.]